jgi:hypothetical protein
MFHFIAGSADPKYWGYFRGYASQWQHETSDRPLTPEVRHPRLHAIAISKCPQERARGNDIYVQWHAAWSTRYPGVTQPSAGHQ